MTLSISLAEAMWFLPFALPICIWVAISDLREMRIPNVAVLALTAVFLVGGFFLLPLDAYGWRLLQLVIVLFIGFAITSLGLVGAGDSKFAAAMAPFVAPGDGLLFLMIFAIVLIGSWVTHKGAARVPAIRRATDGWTSWDQEKLFPMGVALAGALVVYLVLGVQSGL